MIYHNPPWSAMMYHAPIQLGKLVKLNVRDIRKPSGHKKGGFRCSHTFPLVKSLPRPCAAHLIIVEPHRRKVHKAFPMLLQILYHAIMLFPYFLRPLQCYNGISSHRNLGLWIWSLFLVCILVYPLLNWVWKLTQHVLGAIYVFEAKNITSEKCSKL